MFDVEEFYGCCTAKIIGYWAGYPNQDVIMGDDGKRYTNTDTFEGYKKFAKVHLLAACEALNDQEEDAEGDYEDMRANGIIFATFRSDQVHPITFAKEVGFRVTRKAKKGRHPENDLIGAFIDSKDLYKWWENNK